MPMTFSLYFHLPMVVVAQFRCYCLVSLLIGLLVPRQLNEIDQLLGADLRRVGLLDFRRHHQFSFLISLAVLLFLSADEMNFEVI